MKLLLPSSRISYVDALLATPDLAITVETSARGETQLLIRGNWAKLYYNRRVSLLSIVEQVLFTDSDARVEPSDGPPRDGAQPPSTESMR
jgi:hypothetical protein